MMRAGGVGAEGGIGARGEVFCSMRFLAPINHGGRRGPKPPRGPTPGAEAYNNQQTY